MKTALSVFLSLLTIVITGLFSSCEEDSPPSKRPLLIGKSWTLVSYKIAGIDETEECQRDNSMTFFSDGTFLDDIGAAECEEFETNTEGSWSFKANETIIGLRPVGDVESDWTILELGEDRFSISQYVQLLDANVVVVMESN